MRWLRFAQQYVNTGIKPSEGFRIETTIRAKYDTSDQALFGSRGTAGTANSSSFNVFHLFEFGSAPNWESYEYFRMDYAKAGAVRFKTNNTSNRSSPKIYELVLGKTSSVNGATETGGTMTTNNQNIYIGTINNGGSPDTRWGRVDFAYFKIYNASNELVFDGVPVPAGSTEYKTTPAPSNCFYDTVTDSYFTNAGSNFIGYEDDDIAETQAVEVNTDDYGIKILSDDEYGYELMNGKYRLFGADLASATSQFKTFEFTLTGNSEPPFSFPAYVLDGNFYQGNGMHKVERAVIDTGFDPKTVKSIFVVADPITNTNWQARAWQYTTGGGGSTYNTYINPATKNPPAYLGLTTTRLMFEQGKYNDEKAVYLGQQGYAQWNTLGGFNGGTVGRTYWEIPNVYFKFMSDGKLRVSTGVPYFWIQRAFSMSGVPNYYARWKDWAWYQGVTLRISILSTPYIL